MGDRLYLAVSRQPIRPRALLANDLAKRTRVDQWAEWSKINVALNFTGPIFWPVVREPKRDLNALREAIRVLDQYLDIAENQLAGATFLCGGDFTLADVQFGHILYRYFDIDIDRRERASLRSYYERLVARPAYREHVMVSYDELRAFD